MKEENQAIIKALNMYGRVPKMWELLEEIERLKNDIKRITEITNQKIKIINDVREKVKGVKKINNEVYKQTDMLERFYSRKWCNDEMDSFLEILEKENK